MVIYYQDVYEKLMIKVSNRANNNTKATKYQIRVGHKLEQWALNDK